LYGERRETGGKITLDLEEYRYGFESEVGEYLGKLIPGYVSFGGAHSLIDQADVEDGPDAVETSMFFGLGWTWDSADTSIDISRSNYSSGSNAYDEVTSEDVTLDLMQGFYADQWSLFFFASLGNSKMTSAYDQMDDLYGFAGVQLDLTLDELPEFSIGVDYDSYASSYDSDYYGYSDRSENWSFYGKVDLSRYIPWGGSIREPRLDLTYRSRLSTDRGSESETVADLDHAVVLFAGFKF
jgi:hypothetical protein